MEHTGSTLERIELDKLSFAQKRLGKGGFGSVHLAYHKERSCWYAVKRLLQHVQERSRYPL